jgi:hypothetical protein
MVACFDAPSRVIHPQRFPKMAELLYNRLEALEKFLNIFEVHALDDDEAGQAENIALFEQGLKKILDRR